MTNLPFKRQHDTLLGWSSCDIYVLILVLIQAFSESFSKFLKNRAMSLHCTMHSTFFSRHKCLRWIFEGGNVVSDVSENFRDLEIEPSAVTTSFVQNHPVLCTWFILK